MGLLEWKKPLQIVVSAERLELIEDLAAEQDMEVRVITDDGGTCYLDNGKSRVLDGEVEIVLDAHGDLTDFWDAVDQSG
jgi:hypothetical protein